MKLPYLYQKLANLIKTETLGPNVKRKTLKSMILPKKFRITKEDTQYIINDLKRMGVIKRKNRQKFEIQ